jgi:tetratricopeptide (TPR) repeat protein
MAMFDSKKNLIAVASAVAAAMAAFFISTVPAKKSGLYEHIRKAESYIKSGKYDRGIFFLKKAYEAAPGSQVIADEMARGHLEYARHLSSLGEIEGALEQASAAYEAAPSNRSVVNDLAYYLSVRAAKKAFDGRIDKAAEELAIVRKLAETSGTVSTNIANYLFNRALDARDLKDTSALFLLLKTSCMLRPRFETFVFLGTSFYDERNFEKAVFYWEKALSLRPDSIDVRKNIEKAEKEALMGARESTLSTSDFEVIIYGDLGVERGFLEKYLFDVYKNVGRDLEFYPSAGTKIIVYDESDFRNIFQKDGIIRGFYDGNIRIAITGDIAEVFESGVIAHEYAHAAVSALTANNCPIWLHEGIAVHQQSRYGDIKLTAVERALKKGGKLSLDEVEDAFEKQSGLEELVFAYEAAYTSVLFIIDEWGLTGLRELLQGIREEGHYANALDEKFYISVSIFEKKWNDFVSKRLLKG